MYTEVIARIEEIITPPNSYTNDTVVLYEGHSRQKAIVGIAMALSSVYRNQPPGPLIRERMLSALPSRDELNEAEVEDALELRELVGLALVGPTQ